MALWKEFLGGEATARSGNLDSEALINLYRHTVASDADAKQAFLYGTPGLKLLMAVDGATGGIGCRGLWSADGRTFAVVGATFSELHLATHTATSYGTILNDGAPVSLVSNGRGGEQLLIVGGGQVKIFSFTSNTLSGPVSLPGFVNAPVMGTIINGRFLVTEANTIRFWYSDIDNGLSFPALNFIGRSDTADNIVGLAVLKDRVIVIGSLTSEIFYNTTDPLVPFLPYPGTSINQGAPTPWGIVVQDEKAAWLAQSATGPARVVALQGAVPQVISTPETSFAWASYATLADTEALAYEQEGHPFAVWTFPSGDTSFSFDARETLWHQRLGWDATNGVYHRWRPRGCCAVGMQVLVGDYQNGNIYALDLDTFTDNGAILKRLRRAPYLSSENQWLFLDAFELGLQSGVGLNRGQGTLPALTLRTSGDSGHTWNPAVVSSTTGAMGHYGGLAQWNRLGRFRADRFVAEVSQTDPVRTAWGPGPWLRAQPGTGMR